MTLEALELGEGKRKLAFPLFALGLLTLTWTLSCREDLPPDMSEEGQTLHLQGPTMGTTWSVSLHGADPKLDWEDLFQAKLDTIEDALTTWDPTSELMRLNAAGDPFAVGLIVQQALLRAQELAKDTDGAFDPTVQPLVTLWGFGKQREQPIPSEEDIEAALTHMGWDGYTLSTVEDTVRVIKTAQGLQINLSAFAKGWAADQVKMLAEEQGATGGLIEVGGEICLFGTRSDAEPWRIGIEAPAEYPGAPKVINQVLTLKTTQPWKAVATSGDSRNRRAIDDFAFSHIIDPRTGWPLADPPASVTVVARDCATADAWATALMVLGPVEGLSLARKAGLEICFQLRTENGSYREVATEGYELLIADRPNR
ncbi:MAG: FAD:protein FMN transferase [Planctomycetes bacterium]|nr:FAD:protein FMN transferase [Planctomycetota bacterium]